MGHVLLGHVVLLVGEQLLHEARVEIDEVAGAAPDVGQVLDRQTQPARTGGSHHQPGAAAREVGVVDLVAEFRVIDLVVVPSDALLGHAGGAAGLENVEGLALELGRDPDLGLQVAQRFILEVRELQHVFEACDLLAGIPVLAGPIEPELAASGGVEVPLDDLQQVLVELGLGGGDGFRSDSGYGHK